MANQEIRMALLNCVNEMWNIFNRTAKVYENEEAIEKFIEAKNRFHTALTEMTRREDRVENKERFNKYLLSSHSFLVN